ncbi:MAG: hypothetical protein IKQ57_06705, partial [Candidatus Methanomethylophilaceae archaeon]|nr:hypothetical protein [Candidatus Methanomethylophilaceae archaeon]
DVGFSGSIAEFNGVLDGNGKTISGVSRCIFEKIGSSATVKNLKISSPQINSSASSVGVLSIYNYGTISNVTISNPNIDTTGKIGAVAGLIAVNNYGTISNCDVSGGHVYTRGSFGAIAGQSSGKIVNCKVTSISIELKVKRDSQANATMAIGALVGIVNGGSASGSVSYATFRITGEDLGYHSPFAYTECKPMMGYAIGWLKTGSSSVDCSGCSKTYDVLVKNSVLGYSWDCRDYLFAYNGGGIGRE